MNRIFAFAFLLLFAGIVSGQTSKTTSVDIKAEEEALNKLMDKFDAGFANGDPSVFLSSFCEDALICGTDPSEFWTKEQFVEGSDPASTDSFPDIKYTGDRKIKVAPDGNSAIVVTQYIIEWSPKIPWRQTYHFIKTNDNWMIYFMNVAFIPKNEDIEKINDAIE
jgi:hypothetical protein